MKPIIGITSDFEEGHENREARYFLNDRYISAVEASGGVPLILAYVTGPSETALVLDRIQGLVLTGGAFDIDPSYYGETWDVEQGTVKEGRTRFEMEITRQALERDIPVLGICGGEQNINVALKGSLYQDILSQNRQAFNHEQTEEKTESVHDVKIVPGTRLHRIVGAETLRVNSTHHQAVKDPGEGIVVNALADDGIVEGIESSRHTFVLGVQWHPEWLFGHYKGCRRIFEALIHEAARRPLP